MCKEEEKKKKKRFIPVIIISLYSSDACYFILLFCNTINECLVLDIEQL